jgi:hypothetical protein
MNGYHGLRQTCRQLQFEFGPLIDNWVRTVSPIEEVDTFHLAQDASLPYVRKANLIIDTTSISRARGKPNNDGVDILPFVRILGSSAPCDLTVQCLDTRGASEIIQVVLSLAKSYSAWQHLISVLDIQELRLSITADD